MDKKVREDLGFVLRTPTLRAGSQYRIADCEFKVSELQSTICNLKSKIIQQPLR